MMHPGSALDGLRKQGRMIWLETQHGWFAAPDEVMGALARDGFDECRHELTRGERDHRPSGGMWQGIGVWQGINTRTGSVASANWVKRLAWPQAIVFIAIDGESLKGLGPPPGQYDDPHLAEKASDSAR